MAKATGISEAKIRQAIWMLKAKKTKQQVCEHLGIAYNTKSLDNIIQEFHNNIEREAELKKKARLKKFTLEPEIHKDGAIADAVQSNQSVLVQIIKEPISTKGPRISSELSLAGRYLVLVPFSDRVSISQKIPTREEKIRLKKLVLSIKPKGFGVIVRTVAHEKKVAELDHYRPARHGCRGA